MDYFFSLKNMCNGLRESKNTQGLQNQTYKGSNSRPTSSSISRSITLKNEKKTIIEFFWHPYLLLLAKISSDSRYAAFTIR